MDLDHQAIDWCRQHLGAVARFQANEAWPPLAFDTATFDLTYAISVFSHLPEDMQIAWLAELRRVTRPGGYLLLSVLGPEHWGEGLEAARVGLAQRGFAFVRGGSTEGLPDFYQQAFHAETYLRATWGERFEVIEVVPRGIAGYQNLVVCRRG